MNNCDHNNDSVKLTEAEKPEVPVYDDFTTLTKEPEDKDFTEKFVEKCRILAEAGNEVAQAQLGRALIMGLGCQKDIDEAVKWLKMASEKDIPSAQATLGVKYLNGEGVEKDVEKCIELTRKAAESGLPRAQYHLGVFYKTGNGLEKNLKSAVEWFRKAAGQGDCCAQCDLGICYLNGEGIEKNSRNGFFWLNKSAEQGYPEAEYCLGWCYGKGIGVDESPEMSTRWFQKGAEHGDINAQYFLGQNYEYGYGVEKNLDIAAEWYRKASDQGHEKAKKALERLLSTRIKERSKEDVLKEVYAYLESVGVSKDSDDFTWYASFCKVVDEYVHGKLKVAEILEAVDKLSDLLTKGLPGFQKIPLMEVDRIRGQKRAMEWMQVTRGKLNKAEKEALAFCVYYATCIQKYDEKSKTIIATFNEFESKAKIDAEYNEFKNNRLHAEQFKEELEFIPSGKFGFESTNPIMCLSIPQEYDYLKHLFPENGTIVNRFRRGSLHIKLGICDIWDIEVKEDSSDSTRQYQIYICPYGSEASVTAPEGFKLV